MNDTLRDIVKTNVDAVQPPEADLVGVARRGRALRRRRRVAFAAGTGTIALAVGFGVIQTGGDQSPSSPTSWSPSYVTVAAFDPSNGLRAFADPAEDGTIHLGDHLYPKQKMHYLDTDAAATSHGVVFFDRDQKPRLMGSDGRVVQLGTGPATPAKGFHPSAKEDATRPWVAWTEHHGDQVTVRLYDLQSRELVASRDVPCSGKSCRAVKVDGLDQGAAFVRTDEGTFVWRHQDDSWARLGGPKLRVADVRGGTLLYAGAKPTLESEEWRFVPGAIDAQLTFDGKNVLYWSNKLEPTSSGGRTINLEAGSKDQGWYTVDTDGSILVASTTNEQSMTDPTLTADVFDCEVPSGSCTKIGEIATQSGDPMFVGNDM